MSPVGEAGNGPGPRVDTSIIRGFLPQGEGQESLLSHDLQSVIALK